MGKAAALEQATRKIVLERGCLFPKTCSVWVLHQGTIYFADLYFCIGNDNGRTLTLVLLFSQPDEAILQHTHGILAVCKHQGDARLAVMEIESIRAIIGMVPFGENVRGQDPYKSMCH
jgi:hypothetical protein